MAQQTFNINIFQNLLKKNPLLTTNHFEVNILPSASSSSLVKNLLAHYSTEEKNLIKLSVGQISSPALNFNTEETRILGHSYTTTSGFSNSTLSLQNILNSGIQLQFFNALGAIQYSQKNGTYGYPEDYYIEIYINDYTRDGKLKQEHRFQNCVLTNLQGVSFNHADQSQVQTFSATFNYFRYTPYFYDM